MDGNEDDDIEIKMNNFEEFYHKIEYSKLNNLMILIFFGSKHWRDQATNPEKLIDQFHNLKEKYPGFKQPIDDSLVK